MITTKENKLRLWPVSYRFLFAGVLLTVLLAVAVVALGAYIRSDESQVQSASLLQAPAVTSEEVYMMVHGWDGQSSVLVLNPASGEVTKSFEAGYSPAVRLTADRHILYVYEQSEVEAWPDLLVTGITSAIDTRTGTVLWQVDIPGRPYGPSTRTAWLSADEQRLYLQGTPGSLNPHIFVVDTQTRELLYDYELLLPYPANEDMAIPLVWKLPWAETLVVASRDQLFTFDLTSGETGDAIRLFGPGGIQRVPLNLPHTTYVQGGAVDPETQQLFLATSTQEILSVDLNTQPFMVTPVVALPGGWQFAAMQPFLHHPAEKAVYVQVKQSDTPRIDGLEAEEVWVYDTTTWTQQSRLSLREQLAKAPANLTDNSAGGGFDLTNYGLALSPNGQSVYSFSQSGLLEINQDASRRLQGTWLNIGGEDPESFVLKFVVP